VLSNVSAQARRQSDGNIYNTKKNISKDPAGKIINFSHFSIMFRNVSGSKQLRSPSRFSTSSAKNDNFLPSILACNE
jgi:hypothetical protein